MPEGPDGKTIIIVKKVSGHAAAHGGAWKVAYADFVTAMMALFMVLWLVNSASEPTRQRIASYFHKPGIFEKGSGTPVEMGGGGLLPDTFAPPADANSQIITTKKIYEIDAHTGKVRDYFDPGEGGDSIAYNPPAAPTDEEGEELGGKGGAQEKPKISGKATEEQTEETEVDLEKLKAELEEAAAAGKGEGAKEANGIGQVDIKVDQRGLLVEIMDTDTASMFQVGSAAILPEAQQQLSKIAKILVDLPNPVDVEGHTDARPYRGKIAENYDNWDLSVDRANSARRILQQAGLANNKIARVVGYADQRPKTPEAPLNPANRRITIAMRFTEPAKAALESTKTVETKPKPIPLPGTSAQKQQGTPAPEAGQQAKSASEKTPAAAEQKGVEPEHKRKELRVDVQTTIPEGAVIVQPDVPKVSEEPAPPPAGIEKDKIFGNVNPFFGQ
jgi:chemotaxis protein MotB